MPTNETPTVNINSTQKTQRPFLSVIMRTIGKRPILLKEALLCLSAQICTDFEVLLCAHNLTAEAQKSVDAVLRELPDFIAEKINIVPVNGGNRTTPLNVGFEKAVGRYITILDDDDIVFGNWVETFHNLFVENDGKILHSYIVKQNYEFVQNTSESQFGRAISSFDKIYLTPFNYIRQLKMNRCPIHGLAFPREVFHKHNLRFDETISTAEDWDFLMRAVAICGVCDSETVTGIYRWWQSSYSSREEHSTAEWEQNQKITEEKFCNMTYVLPPTGVKQAIDLVEEVTALHADLQYLKSKYALTEVLVEINKLTSTKTWKISAPLRLMGTLRGNWKDLKKLHTLTYEQAFVLLDKIKNAQSVKLVEKVRLKLR